METVANPRSFRLEARSQIVCAYCGKARPFHAHHAVDKGELRKWGITGNAAYDTRNALRLCEDMSAGIEGRCHLQFENRRIQIECRKLRDSNIAYAFEVMGVAALDYLRQEYVGVDYDPRVALKFEVHTALARHRVELLNSATEELIGRDAP